MGKVFANDVSDKGLISKTCKELIQLNNNNNKSKLIKKWAEDLNRHFSMKVIQIANMHVRIYSTLLIVILGKCKSKPSHTCYNGYYQKHKNNKEGVSFKKLTT